MTQEREAKRNYKEAFEVLAKAKAKMEASAQQEEELRKDLIESFDGYLEEKVGGMMLMLWMILHARCSTTQTEHYGYT